MSQSFASDDGTEPAGAASSDEQLEAEIADHLAAAADDLMRRGEAADQAARVALARFGDVARVRRQCWWIHHGEVFMFRTAGIALLSLLTIGVAVVGFGAWRLQSTLTSRTEELSEQLASLTTAQQAMLDKQRPPEITGLAYLGDPSTPAKDVEIQVFRFSEEAPSNMKFETGAVTRRLRTDALGRFDSGILHSGEYCLLGPLMDPEGKASENEFFFKQLQSRPLYLTAGVGKATVDLDLAASARIRLSVTDIPNVVTTAGEEVRVCVRITASTDGAHYYENVGSRPQPVRPSDEPPRDGWPLPLPLFGFATAQRPADLPRAWWLPPRDYSIELQLIFLSTNTSAIRTKGIPIALKLTPGRTAAITLSVVGDSLENRFLAAEKKFENIQPILKSVADGIELNGALAMEERETLPVRNTDPH
jgi:hypothetical protein